MRQEDQDDAEAAPSVDGDGSTGASEFQEHDAPAAARPMPLGTKRTTVGPIALALSGGGFRAAGFHLGLLTALDRVDILDRVRVLSTASGGTIVGAFWMLGRARQRPFHELQFELAKYLTDATPIAAALKRAAKQRITLTQALAREFDEGLLSDSRFATSTMRELFDRRSGPSEGSFNATVATTGLPFRFSFSRGAKARFGNQNAALPRVIAEHVELADVVAASCAFPGGFEPMVIPDDLVLPDEDVRASASEALDGRSIGLVDGGVHDNQGIDALLLASKRYDAPIDLHIVSDADRALDGEEPRVPKRRGWLFSPRVWQISIVSWLIILGAMASIFLIWEKVQAERAINDFRWPSDAIAFGAPIAFCVATILAVLYARGVVKRALVPLAPHLGRRAWRSIKRMRIADLLPAITTRVRTLETVASTTFPRRVRSLVYRSLWADGDFAGRRIAVQMHGVHADCTDLIDGLYAPTHSLLASVKRAQALPTALTLDSQKQLDDLMICGQATLIVKLVESLEREYGPVPSDWPAEISTLHAALCADWDQLNTGGAPLRPR